MKNRFANIQHIAETLEHCIVQFSTGMDSIAMLHLLQTYIPGRYTPVHLQYVAGLSWVEKVISHYEKRFKIKVLRFTHPVVQTIDSHRIHRKQRKVTLSDMDDYIRLKTGHQYIAYGYMKTDSLQRRGQLALKNQKGEITGKLGIDHKYKKVYPIAEWSKRDVKAYIKKHKLLIPEPYEIGFRDCVNPDGEQLIMIRNNYPKDFERITRRFPQLKAEYMRQQAVCDGC